MLQVLGEGNFGKVWKAEVDDICGYEGTILVAVKGVKASFSIYNCTICPDSFQLKKIDLAYGKTNFCKTPTIVIENT